MVIFPLAKKSLKTIELGIIGLITLVLAILNYNQIYIMFGAGIFALLIAQTNNRSTPNSFISILLLSLSKAELQQQT
ncbi:hypothetical protein [Flavobacterium sp. ZS1P14]|uniref:hypothetical protein n=1 Tax=Flavobacterium sp. ZS1P14 TaxID=3401729 RepID=UPI003AAA34E9